MDDRQLSGAGRAWLVVIVLGMCALTGCRIQRGGGAPEAPVLPAAAAGSAASKSSDAGATPARAPAPSSSTSPAATSSSAPAAQGGSPAAPAGGSGSADPMDAGMPAPSSTAAPDSGPPAQAGASAAQGCGRAANMDDCNPISNEGCTSELGLQCDVDMTSTEPRGICVFSAPAPDGGTCLNIPPTETCPAGQTCVDFTACRKVCLCDDDCDAGDCCSEKLGSSGWKTCGKC